MGAVPIYCPTVLLMGAVPIYCPTVLLMGAVPIYCPSYFLFIFPIYFPGPWQGLCF